MGRRLPAVLVIAIIVTTLVVAAPARVDAGPAPNCSGVPSTWTPIGVSEWQQLGPDQYQLVCNFADGTIGGIAVTVEYACPPYAAGRLDSVSGGDTIREGNMAYEREEGVYDVYAGTFTVHDKFFVLIDDRTFSTVAAYTDTGADRSVLQSAAMAIASLNAATASLPGCATPSPVTESPPTEPPPPVAPMTEAPPTEPPPTEPPPPVAPMTEPPATEPPAPTPPARAPLCPEAQAWLDGFGADRMRRGGISDPNRTGMIVDGQFLTDDFVQAIRDHNAAHPDQRAYANPGVPYGQAGALNWLFQEGGVNADLGSAYVVGKEADLRAAIVSASQAGTTNGQPAKLTPGQVYGLALGLTGGDAKQAMLLSHNTLRSLARSGDNFQTGINQDTAFFQRHLVQLRDNADNAGPWYHMFGTAYFSMVDQGDYGELVSAGGAAVLYTLGGPQLALLRITLGVVAGGAAAGHAALSRSRVVNLLEQLYRENFGKDGNAPPPPDPEKFCYNVWGFNIGEKIYDELPTRPFRGYGTPFSGFPAPAPGGRDWDPTSALRDSRFLNVTNSPFAIQWSDGTSTMVFDQGASLEEVQLLGTVPALVVPVAEDDGTWGVAWMAPPDATNEVVFEATRDDAEMTFLRIDGETGETAVYEFTAPSKGDRYTMTLDDGTLAPDIVDPAGGVIRPTELFDLSDGASLADPYAALDTSAASSTDDDDDTLLYVLVGAVVLLGLGVLVAAMIVGSRGSRRRPGPPPGPPAPPYGGPPPASGYQTF